MLRAPDSARRLSLLLGSNRSLDRTRSDDRQEGFLDRIVNAQPAKGNAAWFAIIQPTAATAVARDIMPRAGIAKRQLAAATAAAKQAGEQRIAVLGRTMVPAGGNIVADHTANRLGLSQLT